MSNSVLLEKFSFFLFSLLLDSQDLYFFDIDIRQYRISSISSYLSWSFRIQCNINFLPSSELKYKSIQKNRRVDLIGHTWLHFFPTHLSHAQARLEECRVADLPLLAVAREHGSVRVHVFLASFPSMWSLGSRSDWMWSRTSSFSDTKTGYLGPLTRTNNARSVFGTSWPHETRIFTLQWNVYLGLDSWTETRASGACVWRCSWCARSSMNYSSVTIQKLTKFVSFSRALLSRRYGVIIQKLMEIISCKSRVASVL